MKIDHSRRMFNADYESDLEDPKLLCEISVFFSRRTFTWCLQVTENRNLELFRTFPGFVQGYFETYAG